MRVFSILGWLPLWLLAFAAPLSAQAGDRMWGQVHTVEGDEYEGFIRWDRNEGGWADILNGSKEIPKESYMAWLDARRDGQGPVRTIDLMGYRISWDEEDPDFPSEASSGIRFGHVVGLAVVDEDAVELTLRSGRRVELFGGSTDIGIGIRELVVEDSRHGTVELEWSELDRIVFGPAPPGAQPDAPRLYGTVEDQMGRTFTGFVSWDLDEIYESDVLDGDDDDGDDREIEFGRIRSIRQTERGAMVTLRSGEELELHGTNDVDRGHRGVQISDPNLGMVEVEWDDFVVLHFQELPEIHGYDAFDGGHRLMGAVATGSGEEFRGPVRWDADEQWSWELLDGRSEGVRFTIEFSQVLSIERADSSGATVTLLDGRTFLLDDSNDVDWENKGIFVEPSGDDERTEWQYVSWEDFESIRFEHPMPPGNAEALRDDDASGWQP